MEEEKGKSKKRRREGEREEKERGEANGVRGGGNPKSEERVVSRVG